MNLRIIKIRKKTVKTLALAAILLTATILAVTSIQSQNQNMNPLIYEYVQGISQDHHDIIQEKTLYISSDYTFTGNISEPIVVTADNIVIDGNGYTLQGPGSGTGFDLTGRAYVTIKNVKVEGWTYGFLLYSGSNNNNLTGNTATNNNNGFYLWDSSYNTLLDNNATSNSCGFYLLYSSYNNLSGNMAANNSVLDGFGLTSSSNNNLTGNTATNNNNGFYLYNSSSNTLSGNTATNNTVNGFQLSSSSSNNLSGNTAANNGNIGFRLYNSSNNKLPGNTAVNCSQAYSWSSESINNDFTGSVVANYLRIEVKDAASSPIPGTDVRVETDGRVVYATPWYGGLNSTTDGNGFTPWIAVPYMTFTTNDTMSDNATIAEVRHQNFFFLNNPRTVTMSTSHTETFTATTTATIEVWGETIITEAWIRTGVEIILNGNLTIANGGSLTLISVTLRVNCTANGSNHIEVQSGGALYISDIDGNPNTINDASIITAYNPDYRFLFQVKSGATFQMNNSELHYCGYRHITDPPSPYDWGLWINTNNTILENNTLTNNYHGIILYDAHHNTIRNNNATNNGGDCFLLDSSSNNTLTGNTAYNNTYDGFSLYYCTYSNLTNNLAKNNGGGGFSLSFCSYNNLTGNIATNNTGVGFYLGSGSYNTLWGNTATNGDNIGFFIVSSSNNNITRNTAANNTYDGFELSSSSDNNLTDNTVINCNPAYFWSSDSINNDFTSSVVANYLRIEVRDSTGSPILGVDVRVETDGTVIYATLWYGGSNLTTDQNGFTPWIAVPYMTFTTNDTMSDSATNAEVYHQSFSFLSNPRTVNMSTPHTEIFIGRAAPTVSITVPFSDSSINFGSIYIIGYFNCTGSGFQSIACNDSRFDLLSSNLGDAGVFSFMNKSAIPTSDFWVNITIQDKSGLTSFALRHIIVNQTLVEATITTEIGAGPNQQVNASASMGVELSLNLTKPVSLSIVKIIENIGGSPPSGLVFLGRYVSIVVNDTTAIQGITITIHYTDQEVTGIGLNENSGNMVLERNLWKLG